MLSALAAPACSSSSSQSAASDAGLDAMLDAGRDTSADALADADAEADADDAAADLGADGADAAEDVALDTAADADLPGDGAFTCTPRVVDDAAVGTRFCDLYRDVFSNGGSAACQSIGCHGGSTGYQGLAMKWDGDGCYDALTTHVVVWKTPNALVRPVPGGDSRPVSCIEQFLTPDPDSGAPAFMPLLRNQAPLNAKLDASQLSRLDAWLARGAPYD